MDNKVDFKSCPRYNGLSDEQISAIAEKAAHRALDLAEDQMYRSVGKRVVAVIYWVSGVVGVGMLVAAAKFGWIKL